MTPQELEQEIVQRSGFGANVQTGLREEKIPNGMVLNIILTNAEIIIRERGAMPQLTLLAA